MARILVIEDNPIHMRLTVLLLENSGHETLQAIDAETGLSMAREHKPALIVMDIQMPIMDGLTATRLLKRDTATSNIKIVAITARATEKDLEMIEAAGCDGYVSKPIGVKEFVSTIKGILGGAGNTRA